MSIGNDNWAKYKMLLFAKENITNAISNLDSVETVQVTSNDVDGYKSEYINITWKPKQEAAIFTENIDQLQKLYKRGDNNYEN